VYVRLHGLGVATLALVGLEIGIEAHGDNADEETSEFGNVQAAGFAADQAVGFKVAK
jgi:hypothetical protein